MLHALEQVGRLKVFVGERVFGDACARPFEVGSIGDDDLDLVAWGKMREIRPEIALLLARSRRLEIDDLADARIDLRDVDRA